jgi:hypothetical protein
MSKDTSIALIDYRLDCEDKSNTIFKGHQELQKAEMNHRYYKALKLAGAYAFVDSSPTLENKHLQYAIQLTEDSGESFKAIMNRDRNYVRIAKYLADVHKDVTQVDLMEDVPAYRGTESQKKELITHAIAWGYSNNIIIKRKFTDNIEFFLGEALTATNLDSINIAYSGQITENFAPAKAAFNELYKLTTASGLHYTAHSFKDGYRSSENVIQGFNLLILDIDKGTNLDTAGLLLKDYVHMLSTTKRHTEAKHRFRIILPLSHTIKLDAKGYSEFMRNVFNWLPFDVDEATKDISRKWESSAKAEYRYNIKDAELLDATIFIPQTRKAVEHNNYINSNSSLNNLERWFSTNTEEGNRSNMLIKYGFALLDNGYTLSAVREAILAFNSKIISPLPEDEILMTIMVTLTKKSAQMEA